MSEDAIIRDEKGRFVEGHNAPGPGRPKGKTLKEFQAEEFRNMSDEDKRTWLKDVNKDTRWKMGEGMPSQGVELSGEISSKIIKLDIE